MNSDGPAGNAGVAGGGYVGGNVVTAAWPREHLGGTQQAAARPPSREARRRQSWRCVRHRAGPPAGVTGGLRPQEAELALQAASLASAALAERDTAIVAARDAGASLRAIAHRTGLTAETVRQIEIRHRKEPETI